MSPQGYEQIVKVGIGAMISVALAGALTTVALAQRAQDEGNDSDARLQQTFVQASKAYDEGRFSEAIAGYEGLIQRGYRGDALFYNLGNACFRDGRVGPAVLNYRRAWYYAPRDPDIQANMNFALQTTGAVAPTFRPYVKLFFSFTRATWIALSTAFYWLTFLTGIGCVLLRNRRNVLIRVLVCMVILLVISLLGVAAWTDLCNRPEVVVMTRNQKALFAPLNDSTEHFALPEGSVVRSLEMTAEWVKISEGKRVGWIRRTACEPVCPWKLP